MARRYRITVKYDATDGSLKIESANNKRNLILAANNPPIHSLVWEFDGTDGLVAAGWAPGIHFAPGPEDIVPRYSGPFINLTRTTSSVIASGNTGQGGKYTYQAVLKPPAKCGLREIRSGRARLFNEVPQRADAVVKVSLPAEGEEQLLTVEPEVVIYARGQSILWEVEAAEGVREWYPRIVFDDGPGNMNSHFGPFSSLDTRDQSILCSGSADQPGLYNYVFQMVSVKDGTVLFESSADPTVDDEGEPPDDD